jgi:hypothetical protein
MDASATFNNIYVVLKSSKWKFEFTGMYQILEFILYVYI